MYSINMSNQNLLLDEALKRGDLFEKQCNALKKELDMKEIQLVKKFKLETDISKLKALLRQAIEKELMDKIKKPELKKKLKKLENIVKEQKQNICELKNENQSLCKYIQENLEERKTNINNSKNENKSNTYLNMAFNKSITVERTYPALPVLPPVSLAIPPSIPPSVYPAIYPGQQSYPPAQSIYPGQQSYPPAQSIYSATSYRPLPTAPNMFEKQDVPPPPYPNELINDKKNLMNIVDQYC